MAFPSKLRGRCRTRICWRRFGPSCAPRGWAAPCCPFTSCARRWRPWHEGLARRLSASLREAARLSGQRRDRAEAPQRARGDATVLRAVERQRPSQRVPPGGGGERGPGGCTERGGAVHPRERCRRSGLHARDDGVDQPRRSRLGGAAASPGRQILVTEVEHHSNLLPWQRVATATGAGLRMVAPEVAAEAIGPQTRVVALSLVSNVLGTALPAERI